WCRIKLFGIPIGRWICSLLSTLFAPLVLAAMVAAWIAGSSDNRDFEGAGDLNPGDVVVIHGRWVYDAGHTGWNELHAVLSLQKIGDTVDAAAAGNLADFPDLRQRCCELTRQ